MHRRRARAIRSAVVNQSPWCDSSRALGATKRMQSIDDMRQSLVGVSPDLVTCVPSSVSALGECYAVVRRLVGEEFFHTMAHMHVAQETTRQQVCDGTAFPEFVENFRPAAAITWLADV